MTLKDFLDRQHDLVEATKKTYLFALNKFEALSGTPFEKMYLNEKKVHEILNLLSKQVSMSSWNTYLQKYKRYAKFLSDPDDEVCPKVWSKIKRKNIDWKKKLKNKWLTKKQFYKLLDVVDYPRDKALICVCLEGGLRAGELIGLKIKDVHVASYGYDVTVSGKTGSSSFPVVLFAPLLKHWLNFHPFKDDPDSPLWVRRKGNKSGLTKNPLCRFGVYLLITKYAKRAGLPPISLHWLRHTKITWTAKNKKVRVSDEMAKKMFRWSKNSRMFSHYTHLHGVDTNNAFLALAGVKQQEEEETDNVLQPKKCLNCSEVNSVEMLYCGKCGFVLNEEEATKMVQQKKLEEIFMRLAVKQLDLDRELKKLEKEENKNVEQIMFVEQAKKAVNDLSRTVHDDAQEFKEITEQKQKKKVQK